MPLMVSPIAIIQLRKKESVYRRKKTKKNAIPNPPNHAPGFGAFPPLDDAVGMELELDVRELELVVLELVPVSKDSTSFEGFTFEGFLFSDVGGDVGSELAMVVVGLIEIEVKGSSRVVLGMTVGFVEGGAVLEERVGFGVVLGLPLTPPLFRHS